MKKILTSICIVSAFILGAIEWDFTKSDALKGKYALTTFGKQALSKNGLAAPVTKGDDRSGAATILKYPEFTPKGNFYASVEFIIDGKAKHAQAYLVLLDNKYVPTDKNPKNHCGFMLYLQKKKPGIFVPMAAFGYGKSSAVVTGREIKITPDKRHTLVMNYYAKNRVDFIFDGKSAGSAKVPAAVLVPGTRPLHIGNRAGKVYWPLGGTVVNVKINTLVAQKAKAATPFPRKWNFISAAVLKGKYAPKLRGSKITKTGLAVLNNNVKKPSGAFMSGKFPELTPPNAFEISANVILDAKFKRTNKWSMIYDAKYIAMPKESEKKYHKGFMFFFVHVKDNTYKLGGAFGYGTKSAQVLSKNFEMKPGTAYNLTMLFNSTGKVTFAVNGKIISIEDVPAGKIAVPEGKVAFGDRIGATYWPLGGTLKSIEIKTSKFTPVAALSVPVKRSVFEGLEKKLYFI